MSEVNANSNKIDDEVPEIKEEQLKNAGTDSEGKVKPTNKINEEQKDKNISGENETNLKNVNNANNANNVTNLNNSSLNDDELMAHIDKEADNVSGNINHEDLNIFNKYDNLSDEDLRKIIKEKK